MSGKAQFSIGKSEYIGRRSNEIGSHRTLVTGVRSAEVKCACGHAWIADARNGLLNVMGGVHITCPACKTGDMVNIRMFRAA